MNSGKQLIIGVAILITIILIFLFSTQFNGFNKNDIPENLTIEINRIINESGKNHVSMWEANSTQQQATIYYNCIYYRDKNKKYDGKIVDGWNISIAYDPESFNVTAIDAIETKVLNLWKEQPELNITFFEYHECEKEFWLFVSEYNSENRKLNGEIWEGRTIVVVTLHKSS